MTTLADRALVARTVATLARHGYPTGRALKLVTAAIPDSPLRKELDTASAALERGEPATSADPLVSLLSRGEQAGPEALGLLSLAMQRAAQSRMEAKRLALLVAAPWWVIAVMIPVLSIVGRTFTPMFQSFGSALPAPTQFVLDLAGLFGSPLTATIVAVIVGVAGWFAGRRASMWRGPDSAMRASSLSLASAGLLAGLDEPSAVRFAGDPAAQSVATSTVIALDRFEKHAFELASARLGLPAAARMLAEERANTDAAGARVVAAFSTVFVMVILGLVIGAILVAMYLPIFSVAGAIK